MQKRFTCALLALPIIAALASCGKDDEPATPVNTTLSPNTRPYVYTGNTFFIAIPSAFTPNGDGRNDVYGPVTTTGAIPGYHFKVTDGSGLVLFETTRQRDNWQAIDNKTGTYYPAGVYKAILNFTSSNGVAEQKELNFSLLKLNASRNCLETGGRVYCFPDQIDESTGSVNRPTAETKICE